MLTTSKLVWQKSLRGMAGFTSAEFRVLMMMSTYTDAKGCGAHPGMDRLASDSCVDRRTAQRAAASLIKKGWLICKRKGGNEVGWRVRSPWNHEITKYHVAGCCRRFRLVRHVRRQAGNEQQIRA